MAATVQIQVTIDEKGVVTGLQNIGTAVNALPPQFTNLGNVGHQAYDRMSNDMEKAHVAGLLLERDLGVHLPRAMLTLILQSQAAQQALLAVFSVTSAGLFLQSIPAVLSKLQALSDWAGGYDEDLKQVQKDAKAASDQALVDPKSLEQAAKNMAVINAAEKNFKDSNAAVNAEMMKRLEIQKGGIPPTEEQLQLENELYGSTELTGKQEAKVNELRGQGNELQAAQVRMQKALNQELLAMQNAADLVGKKGLAAIEQEAINAKRIIDEKFPAATTERKQLETGVDKEAGAKRTAQAQEEAEAVKHIEAEARASTLEGMAQMRAKRDEEVRQQQVRLQQGEISEQQFLARKLAINQDEAEKEVVANRKAAEELKKIREEITQVGMSELDKLGAAADAEVRKERDLLDRKAISQQQYEDKITLIDERAGAQANELRRKWAAEDADAQIKGASAGATGVQKINLELQSTLQHIAEQERERGMAMPGARVQAEAEAAEKIRHIREEEALDAKDRADLVRREQEKAAADSLPPWLRADAEALASYRHRLDEIDQWQQKELEKNRGNADQMVLIEQQAQQRRRAAWTDENARIADDWRKTRDKLATDLEDLFSGDIAKNIQKEIQHFFFQILASWLMTIDGVRQAASSKGSGGGLLGGLLGGLTGMGGGQSGGVALPPGVQPTFLLPGSGPALSGGAAMATDMISTASAATSTSAVPVWIVGSSASPVAQLAGSPGGTGGGGLLGALIGGITGSAKKRVALPSAVQPTVAGGQVAGASTTTLDSGQIAGGTTLGLPGGVGLPPGVQPPIPGVPQTAPGATLGGADISGGYSGGPMITPAPSSTGAIAPAAATPQLPVGAASSMPGLPPDLLSIGLPASWPGGAGTSSIPPITTGPLGTGLPSAGVGVPSITKGQATAAGLAGAGIAMLGSKLGGTAGSIGGLISMLSITAAGSGPGSAAATAVLNFFGLSPAIAAGAAGGLIGFGVGQKYGKLPGMLAGAGAGIGMGAILGMLGVVGGPIGMIIGGIVGLLGGLFGGLLGGSQRRAQANAYAQNQVEPALAKALEDYNLHQSDFASALANLVAIQDQAQKALGQLKGEGSDVMQNRIAPDIQKLLDQITSTEAERQRRSALQFGAPQFQEGGYISPYLPRNPEGGVLAVLHPEEFVSTAEATALHRAELESWNLAGGGTQTVSTSGVPQFELGGFISGELAGFRMSSGDVMGALQRGAPAAAMGTASAAQPGAAAGAASAAQPGAAAGAASGDTHLHLHAPIQAWDAQSVDRWLRNGGDRKLKSALVRAWREYSGSGPDIGY